jgi:hypothetical protein
MLSDDSIDELAQPIVDRQERINLFILTEIARKVKDIGNMTPSEVRQLVSMLKYGADAGKINKELSKQTKMQVKEIQWLIKYVAKDTYSAAKPLYDATAKPYTPYEDNKDLQRLVKAIEIQTAGTYTNISKAQAFMLRDPQNPTKLIPTDLSDAYDKVVDTAIQSVLTEVTDYHSAIRESLTQLMDSGLQQVTYEAESGKVHHQRLDTAVRRNILDGVREINQGIQDLVGDEIGANAKEISVHAYPAEDHAPVQGHQFTNTEFEKMQDGEDFIDLQGRKYTGFRRAIGTLNCRHFAFNIVIGTSPNYTDEELQAILDRNEKGYTDSKGKHYTMYQCTQMQRAYELKIRRAKENVVVAVEAGDMELAKKYQADVLKYNAQYKEFCKSCGLKVRFDKTKVPKYSQKTC